MSGRRAWRVAWVGHRREVWHRREVFSLCSTLWCTPRSRRSLSCPAFTSRGVRRPQPCNFFELGPPAGQAAEQPVWKTQRFKDFAIAADFFLPIYIFKCERDPSNEQTFFPIERSLDKDWLEERIPSCLSCRRRHGRCAEAPRSDAATSHEKLPCSLRSPTRGPAVFGDGATKSHGAA